MIRDAITNIDSIIPSRHSSDDIMWDRYIIIPIKDAMKAMVMFI